MSVDEILRELTAAQELRDRHEMLTPMWIAADAVVAHWCKRLNEACEATA